MNESTGSIFNIFLRLGLTSFGGPIAHLGYFREEFVNRRRWVSDNEYADLVALCQSLPGPASSQVGLSLGYTRGGVSGAIAAWCGFTLPSAIALILAGYGILSMAPGQLNAGWIQGLKAVAVAVVAKAIAGMYSKICISKFTTILAFAAGIGVCLFPTFWGQILAILGGAALGTLYAPMTPLAPSKNTSRASSNTVLTRYAMPVFFGLLIGLPLLSSIFPNGYIAMVDTFYRIGSMVFGGGHVVLPLMQAEVVGPAWVSQDAFLAGYGAAQAVPGPLFTLSAFLGTVMSFSGAGGLGVFGGMLALLAIFFPSLLLISGVLPHWQRWRENALFRAALVGVNASVVGLLMAAFYHPVCTAGIVKAEHAAIALLAYLALDKLKVDAWKVVFGGALVGWLLIG